MAEKIVTTIKGVKAPRNKCRYISGDYYLIGDPKVKDSGDCYKIGDRFYRLETGYIVFDEYIQEYVINNDSLVKGIIGVNKDKTFVFGYFSKNPLYNSKVAFEDGSSHMLMDESILEKDRRFRFHKERGMFLDKAAVPARKFNALPYLDRGEKHRLPYNCDSVLSSYKKAHAKADIIVDNTTMEYASYLKGLTYGIEFETVEGKVPSKYLGGLGLIPLRDGSISGLEYATVPYEGAKGLAATRRACELLTKYTRYDKHCSLHLHIGGMPRTKEFLLALFKTLCIVQDEVFSMFPLYKKYNFGVKRKNYTKPLPAVQLLSKMDAVITSSNIDKNFDELFKFLSMGIPLKNYGSNSLEDVTHHPSDPRGSSKWNIRSRYYWVNLIPIVFGNKKTVEFRIHTPTTDFNKVSTYLYMCSGIINYVKENQGAILSGNADCTTLNDIIYNVYRENSSLVSRLGTNLDLRRSGILKQNSKGDIVGDEDSIKVKSLMTNSSSASRESRAIDEWAEATSSGSYMERMRRVSDMIRTSYTSPPNVVRG